VEYPRKPLDGGRLAEDFSYASDTNSEWLTGAALLAMLDETPPQRRRRASD
jgi:UDP-N-acetylglucosamine 4,6-dehydratase